MCDSCFILTIQMQHFKPLLRTASQQINRSMQSNIKPFKDESLQRVLPKVIDNIRKSEFFYEIPQVKEHLLKILTINVGGKRHKGLTTVYAYEMLEKPENITEQSMELACVLGWCVETVEAFLVIADDIIDNSQTRGGAPCWYRQLDVGWRAISNCTQIRAWATEIVKLYFHEKPFHTRLNETIDHALFQVQLGQHLDYITAYNRDYNQFTNEHYNTIAKYKAGSYRYNLSVSLALILCNITDKEILKLVEEISVDIGIFYQLQDDFIDVYGDPKITGKEGTDIIEGKCSWLAVNALSLCTPQQRVVFKKCYGSKEPAHEERIKLLFDKLRLHQHYLEHEDKQYRLIKKKIQNLPPHISHELFNKLIDDLYRRNN